jgi:nuclear pore complex protein Nup54
MKGERPISDQMQTLFNKWNPDSQTCVFQSYFYNSVNPEHVPYYGPNPDEDPQKWEEALQKRPTEGSVPVLARGFVAVGQRLELQAKSLQVLHQRLHEINQSLLALMQRHDLEISTRCAEAKRKHIALSARCLRLATKVQVLRYKGYPLDGAEEELKKKLSDLEKAACDPALEARSNEIWARMHTIRARTAILQEETERLGKKVNGSDDDKIDEATMAAIKKVRC